MNRTVIVLLLLLASACGKWSAGGTIVGGAAGAGVGIANAEDNGKGGTIGALVGAAMGLVIGGIIDVKNMDWSDGKSMAAEAPAPRPKRDTRVVLRDRVLGVQIHVAE